MRLIPHLWYAKDADKAAEFYASIIPDSRVISVETMPGDSPSGPEGSVKIVKFIVLGQEIWGLTAGPHHEFNDAISLLIECDTQDEIDRLWEGLGEGGKYVACGWLNDKYGLRWQITAKRVAELMSDPDRERARRATKAFLNMVKVDIAAAEAAADGKQNAA